MYKSDTHMNHKGKPDEQLRGALLPTTFRTERIAEQITAVLAKWLSTKAYDSRLQHIHIVSVILSTDLKEARLFVTAHTQAHLLEGLSALTGASGALRHVVARHLKHLRIIPRFYFSPATSPNE